MIGQHLLAEWPCGTSWTAVLPGALPHVRGWAKASSGVADREQWLGLLMVICMANAQNKDNPAWK